MPEETKNSGPEGGPSKMIYVGIDLHRKRSQIAALDEQGTELLSRRVANDPEGLKAILAELGDELQVALEATYGWEWLADLLEAGGHELHLSHPLRTKAIAAARVKTDAVDARMLAHLLRTDLLPEAYIAPRELRDLRDLLRHRVVLTRMRSALKNRVHALLARQGIQREHADLFGAGGRRYLAKLALREPARRRLDSLLSLIGDSDGHARLGHISQQGSPHIRWALVEAAQKAAQGGGPLRAAFERIAKRRGRNIAKVAVARKMLTLCYYGLRDGEIRCLQPPGPASARPVKAA